MTLETALTNLTPKLINAHQYHRLFILKVSFFILLIILVGITAVSLLKNNFDRIKQGKKAEFWRTFLFLFLILTGCSLMYAAIKTGYNIYYNGLRHSLEVKK
jgi:hypothetical protein